MTDQTPARTAFLAMDNMLKQAEASVAIDDGNDSFTMGAIEPDGISGVLSPDPTKKVFPPSEAKFEDEDVEFIRDPALDQIKNRLIAELPEFGVLQRCNVDILWKAKGGQSGGKLTFGKCQKLSGLALWYSGETFVIWIAADHVRDHAFNQYQLEALIYHELSHCGWELNEKTGETKWMVQAHDATVFFNEIARYGTWQQDLRILKQSYEQLALKSGG